MTRDTRELVAVPQERIDRAILLLRGEKDILDLELAALYGVPTKRLNEQVKRNGPRFPSDFMFQLTEEERVEVVAICDHLPNLRFSPRPPLAFTEHGAIMAANVLNSEQAIAMSVHIVRAFVRLRQGVLAHQELSQKLRDLEARVAWHDAHLAGIVRKLREMAGAPVPRRRRTIGYLRPDEPDTER